MKLKINKEFGIYHKNQQLDIQVDANGIPIKKYWRDRLKDAESDNCVSIVKATSSKKSSIKQQEKDK